MCDVVGCKNDSLCTVQITVPSFGTISFSICTFHLSAYVVELSSQADTATVLSILNDMGIKPPHH